jgi:hypothetical protein
MVASTEPEETVGWDRNGVEVGCRLYSVTGDGWPGEEEELASGPGWEVLYWPRQGDKAVTALLGPVCPLYMFFYNQYSNNT